MFKITNGNSFDFSAAFNGETYSFPKGKTVACDDEAAAHIFGLDQRDKTGVLSRHGWITVTGPKSKGLGILANFKFDPVKIDLGVESALIEHGPAPVLQEAGDEEDGTDGPSNKSSAIRGQLSGQTGLALGRQSPA